MRTPTAVTVLAVLATTPLGAQQGERHLQSGDWSLSFGVEPSYLTTNSGSFALWRMISGRVNAGLGITFGGSVDQYGQEDSVVTGHLSSSTWSLRIEPAVKWYLRVPRRVAPYPYFAAGPTFRWHRYASSGGTDDRGYAYGGSGTAALGVDWLPIRWLSVGGHTGFRVEATRDREQYVGSIRPQVIQDRVSVQSFTSNVFVQIYF